MIRILHVIGAMNCSGAETLIMNIYRQINRSKVQFDFLVHTEAECDYDSEITYLGGKLYRLPEFRGYNAFSYKKQCYSFFKTHPEYRIVHGHIGKGAPIYLSVAKKFGCRTIAHAHSENFYKGFMKIAFKFATFPTRFIADYFVACSESACRATFGKRIENSHRCLLLKNGICVSDYECTPKQHHDVKHMFELNNKIVITHVGRFIDVKNHPFLIKTFGIIKQQLPNCVLLLAGEGPLISEIKSLVKVLNLNGSVFFLGVRKDIPQILKATDIFIFPSKSEGLGLAAIEAQASGSICLISTGVPEAAIISDNAYSLPLAIGEEKWAEEAIRHYINSDISKRFLCSIQIRNAGYDINDSAMTLLSLYSKILGCDS